MKVSERIAVKTAEEKVAPLGGLWKSEGTRRARLGAVDALGAWPASAPAASTSPAPLLTQQGPGAMEALFQWLTGGALTPGPTELATRGGVGLEVDLTPPAEVLGRLAGVQRVLMLLEPDAAKSMTFAARLGRARDGLMLVTSDAQAGGGDARTARVRDALAREVVGEKRAEAISANLRLTIAHNSGLFPAGMDVQAFVQAVLRESYMLQNDMLRDYSEKVKFYNNLKKSMREQLRRAREGLLSLKDRGLMPANLADIDMDTGLEKPILVGPLVKAGLPGVPEHDREGLAALQGLADELAAIPKWIHKQQRVHQFVQQHGMEEVERLFRTHLPSLNGEQYVTLGRALIEGAATVYTKQKSWKHLGLKSSKDVYGDEASVEKAGTHEQAVRLIGLLYQSSTDAQVHDLTRHEGSNAILAQALRDSGIEPNLVQRGAAGESGPLGALRAGGTRYVAQAIEELVRHGDQVPEQVLTAAKRAVSGLGAADALRIFEVMVSEGVDSNLVNELVGCCQTRVFEESTPEQWSFMGDAPAIRAWQDALQPQSSREPDALVPVAPEDVAYYQERLETFIKTYEDKIETVGGDAQMANIDLQNALQRQQQILQMMSNISKTLHDTASSIIRKMGA